MATSRSRKAVGASKNGMVRESGSTIDVGVNSCGIESRGLVVASAQQLSAIAAAGPAEVQEKS